ncbi:MAG: MFS transporter [Burkholderiales bacterium]|nr:MFS transporter [Burkholderiales bacterium]
MSGLATLPQSPQPGIMRLKDVWLISAGHAMTHWYTATFYLLLPLIGSELGLSYVQIGFIMTVQHAVGAASNLPAGMLVDRYANRGLMMAAALFWVGFPYLLMGFTSTYWVLLACVTLVSVGNNIWHPTAISTLADRYPARKGVTLSVHGMGGNVGEAVAPLVVGAMLAVFTWREVVVMNVVPGVFASLLILAMLGALPTVRTGRGGDARPAGLTPMDVQSANAAAPRPRPRWSDQMSESAALLRNRAMMMICTSAAFRTMTQTGLLVFLPLYLAHDLGYSIFAVGVCLFVLQAAGFAASPIAGHLSDRLGRSRIVAGSMLMSAVVIGVMLMAPGTLLFVFCTALLGFFLYAVRAVLQAWMLDTTPASASGSAVGIMFSTQAIGAAVAPLLAGWVADTWGLFAVFYFLAGTIVLANCFVFLMPRDMFQRPSQPMSGPPARQDTPTRGEPHR